MKMIYRNVIGMPAWVENGFDVPQFFNRFIARPGFEQGVSTPAVNIVETPDEFRLEMVAPGMRKEDFRVELQNDVLTITYDHADNRSRESDDWVYRTHEYNYHSFTRSFSVPDTIAADDIRARYENGILSIVLPKKEEARSRVRRIAVG